MNVIDYCGCAKYLRSRTFVCKYYMRLFRLERISRDRSSIRNHEKIKEILQLSDWTRSTIAFVLNSGEVAHLSANNRWCHLQSNALLGIEIQSGIIWNGRRLLSGAIGRRSLLQLCEIPARRDPGEGKQDRISIGRKRSFLTRSMAESLRGLGYWMREQARLN